MYIHKGVIEYRIDGGAVGVGVGSFDLGALVIQEGVGEGGGRSPRKLQHFQIFLVLSCIAIFKHKVKC